MVHFLYFPSRASAAAASEQLIEWGFVTEVRPAALGDDWLLRAEAPASAQIRGSDELRTLAEKFGGEYDGWEAPVSET